jgi:hypothetical protein
MAAINARLRDVDHGVGQPPTRNGVAQMSTVVDIRTALDPWTVDALLEHYVYWREECIEVVESYRRWLDCERGLGRLAYAGYLAALDREEQAARAYADQIERVRGLLT